MKNKKTIQICCSVCGKTQDVEVNDDESFIDIDNLIKSGWVFEDEFLVCSDNCKEFYSKNENKKSIVEFCGNKYIGDNCLIFNNVVLCFPTRDNITRSMIGREIEPNDLYIGEFSIIRPGTIIYEGVHLGERFESGHGVMIRENTVVGKNVRVGSYSVLEGDITIGDDVNIQSFVYIPKHTKIGNNVFIGPRVTFTNDKYPPFGKDMIGATISDNVSIGANVTILPGITIGENSFIAAGAVVTKDIPPLSMAIGFPAKTKMLPEKYIDKWVYKK